MAVDERERQRELSAAEQARLERYERVSAELVAQGYQRSELTIGIVRANVLTLVLGLPFVVVGVLAFFLANHGRDVALGLADRSFLMIGLVLVLVVVHELIHGLTWSIFSAHHWADIEFGFMKEYLTPYCTAASPLPRGGYILGALMPMITLGLVPTIYAIATADLGLLVVGIIMTLAGGGDLLIVIELLRHKSRAQDVLVYDHPTQAGAVVFER